MTVTPIPLRFIQVSSAVGGAFLNVLFDRLAPHGDLLKMFQNHKHDNGLLEKLEDILLDIQIVLRDAENKQASDQRVKKWLNKLQIAVDGAENLLKEVNYEALRLKVEGKHQNLAETSNQQVSDLNLSLSDDFFLNIEEKLKDTIKNLEELEKKICRLGLKEHFVSELENVIDRREAQKAKMGEKEQVEKLSLKWSGSIAHNSQTERDILDELHPHTNIKELQISGYRGTQFPNWLADHSFLKLLVQLSLSNCKDCFSLPALGQLPCLKFLSIRKMHRIKEVTEEFYGSLPSKKPFNSLEKLEFAEMPEWKQWHVLGNGEFPALQDLSIEDCPKLIGKLPENLCSLTKLRISRCPELNLETPIQLSSLKSSEVSSSPKAGVVFDEAEQFTSQLEGLKQIEELCISGCYSLTSLHSSTMISNMFLEELSLIECDSISSPELVSRAHKLWIRSCQNLTRFLIPNGTETLHILSCENLEILSVACGTQMTSLHIHYCKKLKRLPEVVQELLPSLKELRLSDYPEIESFPGGGLPFNLQLLVISKCEKLSLLLHSLPTESLGSLTSLQSLAISSCHQLQSLPDSALPSSLSVLTIRDCPNLQSLPESAFPSSLSELTIGVCPKLQSLVESALPSSLSELTIYNCPNLQSLPESAFPSSLSKMSIHNCPNLQSLPESAFPSSLSVLTIYNCPNLQSLPVKGMPSSLSKLSIHKCPLLKPPLEFDKGEYWQKIAHISTIYIDGECL
ncbi:hypothetical protein P3S68_002666 [Capsicum galapagoense]